MRTIMVLNAKGGSGKSTIATNLASYYAYDGITVLADFDPQASCLDWLKDRPAGKPPIKGIAAYKSGFKVPRNADFLIIDTPARVHGRELTDLIRRAQSVIIPVLPSPVDMRAVSHFIKEVMSVGRVQRKETKIGLVANRCRENTNIYQELNEYLRKMKNVPLITALRDTQNYNRASVKGIGIYEMAPYLVNRDLEQWDPLIRWLNSNRSMPMR